MFVKVALGNVTQWNNFLPTMLELWHNRLTMSLYADVAPIVSYWQAGRLS